MAADRPLDPIERIEWRDVATLEANSWNPNTCFSPEMKLLERSILLQGWIQPILINRDGMIIDGFHRATLAKVSEPIRQRYAGRVPCTVLDIPRPAAMIITIRMNRAKGSHAALPMSQIVRELIDVHGYDPQEVAAEIGATKDEIDLLRQEGVFAAKKIDTWDYSKAWYPRESSHDPA